MNDPADVAAHEALDLSAQIRPMLAGRGPSIQAAALMDLVSLWLAGHRPSLRRDVFETWIDGVREMVGPSERQIFEQIGGKPEGWDDPP